MRSSGAGQPRDGANPTSSGVTESASCSGPSSGPDTCWQVVRTAGDLQTASAAHTSIVGCAAGCQVLLAMADRPARRSAPSRTSVRLYPARCARPTTYAAVEYRDLHFCACSGSPAACSAYLEASLPHPWPPQAAGLIRRI